MSATSTKQTARDLFGDALVSASRSRQLPLPLGWRAADAGSDTPFLIGDSNRTAVQHILDHRCWIAPATVLVGPRGSGRTLLGQAFIASGGGELIDNLASADEIALFHAWNRAQGGGARLLVIAASPTEVAAISLPDLRTRLASAPMVEFGAPDACLTRDLIERLLNARGLNPAPQLGSYVAARIERSYAAIHAAVAAIDAHALASGQGASIAIARAALIEAGLYEAGTESESPEPA